MKQIGIIGGGASGMMAAIAAAGQGAQVTILEKQDRIGKKILATGNGKCNLSNLSFCVQRDYRSEDLRMLEGYFKKFGVAETVSFFKDCGLVLTEKNGYLYPRSGQASTVLNLFLERLERFRVCVSCGCRILSINRKKTGTFEVVTEQKTYLFDALILAAGSPAGTKQKDQLGGCRFADMLGLKTGKMLPALTALHCQGEYWKALAGVRCDGTITLQINENGKKPFVITERGELQLTDYGLSGIPTFQVSRYASLALSRNQSVTAKVDFFPDIPLNCFKSYCEERVKNGQGRNVTAFLEGMVNKKIAQVLLKEAGLRQSEQVRWPMSEKLWKAFCLMREFSVKVTGTNPAANAQVCLGGVFLSEMDENLQANKIPGLYVTGELLDVDGRCGGYNLQWAWSSGWIAGTAAGADGRPKSCRN